FRLQSGIDIVIVQYKGGGPALTDTIAGQVQMNIGSAVQNIPQVRSGKLRALGVGGKNRLAALPDVPTFAEAGLPGAEATNWWGVVAPAGTPAAVLERLEKEIGAVVESPEMQKRFQVEGAEALRMSPQDFGAHIAAETAKWTRVVREAGIKAE
ncbi:MAG TPA: tripartite tricarboxylate transporter substrate-binding protein, partial [Burkholderiales bacterium]|nr:tripartite tricarboxylate transporter substrate-binding protein [Burkholderiales bacterium]